VPAGVAGTGRAGAGGSRLVATTGRRTRTSGRRGGRRARPRPGPDRLTRRVNSHSRGPGRRRSPSSGWNRVRVRPWSRSVTGRRRRACARAGTGGRTVEPDEQGRGAGGREGERPGRAGDDVERAGRGDGEDDGGDEGHARDGVADDVFEPGEARDQPAREDGLDDEVPPRRRHATRADVGGGRGRGGESAPVLARTNAPTSAPGRVPASTPARSRSGPGRRRPASTRASPASRVLRARLVPARDGVDEAERVQWRRHEAGGVVRAAAASVAWGRT
jgi:hypothetical protein